MNMVGAYIHTCTYIPLWSSAAKYQDRSYPGAGKGLNCCLRHTVLGGDMEKKTDLHYTLEIINTKCLVT